MALRSEHAEQRIAAAAALLRDLWGDGLPPGHAPWQRIAADVLDIDDGYGARTGMTVQGDELPLTVLSEALSYVPTGSSLLSLLPDSLADRMLKAAAVRDPGARGLAIGGRLLSAAIRASGARWAAAYLNGGEYAELESSLGMTPWERSAYEQVFLPGDGVLCAALQRGRCERGPVPVPVRGHGWGGEPELEDAPSVAVPFPSTGSDVPAPGALLLVWPTGADPDPAAVQRLIAPLAAEAEHLLSFDER